MQHLKTSTPQPIPFTVVSISNLQTRLDPTIANGGGAMSFTVRVIKSNGSSVAGTGTGGIGSGSGGVTQPDATNAKGVCFYTPGATDINVAGPTVVRISDANNLMEPREIPIDIVAWDPYDIGAAAFSHVVEGAEQFDQLLRLIRARLIGKATVQDGDGTYTFRDAGDTKNRVVLTRTGTARAVVSTDGT